MTTAHKFMGLIFAFALSVLIITIAFIGLKFSGGQEEAMNSGYARMFVLLGGHFKGGGYIQFATYIAFFWSFFDIYNKTNDINQERNGYKQKLLPTKEKIVLLSSDVVDIQIKASNYEKKHKYHLLASIIKKACIKFRSSKSVGEMIEIISIQTEINKEKYEGQQSNIRYLTWVIPSIGFIGTVLGISKALMVANSADMNLITATLGVAFDTTLIALVLSIIIMWFFHHLQEQTDNLHAEMKEYVIENLVNRIEV